MQNAQRVAPVHVTGNYSYDARQMGGPGWILIGDAFAFLDPVFSSGVYLAMSGAEQAAEGNLRKAVQENPDDAELLAALGFVAQRHFNESEARELYERALKIDPLLVDDGNSETIRYLTGGVLIRINRKLAAGLMAQPGRRAPEAA